MVKKVLCPVNFSDTAMNALAYACQLASMHQASITLMHVLTHKEYDKMLEQEDVKDKEMRKNAVKAKLEASLESLCLEVKRDYPALHCLYFLHSNKSRSRSITEYARQEAFELIVMGNNGVADVGEAMAGSITVRVIEKAPCAVMSIPYPADFSGLAKTVFATDFNKADKKALQYLHELLLPAASKIDVLHLSKEEKGESFEEGNKKLAALKNQVNIPEMNFLMLRRKDSIGEELNRYMEESGAELLVLCTHQHNILERWFQKSISKNLSYFVSYPLLIFLEENLK